MATKKTGKKAAAPAPVENKTNDNVVFLNGVRQTNKEFDSKTLKDKEGNPAKMVGIELHMMDNGADKKAYFDVRADQVYQNEGKFGTQTSVRLNKMKTEKNAEGEYVPTNEPVKLRLNVATGEKTEDGKNKYEIREMAVEDVIKAHDAAKDAYAAKKEAAREAENSNEVPKSSRKKAADAKQTTARETVEAPAAESAQAEADFEC